MKNAPGTLNDSTTSFDRVGNILTLVDGGTGAGFTTSYRYGAANNLIAVAEPNGSCPATISIPNSTKCTKISYDTVSERKVTMQNPNGITTAWDTTRRPGC